MFALTVSGFDRRSKSWAWALGMGLGAAVFVVVPAPAPAQEAAQEEATEAAEAAESTDGARQIRRRLVDATSQEEEWTPSFQMSPVEEQRELVQRGQQALDAGRLEGPAGALALFERANGIGRTAAADEGIARAAAELVRQGEAALAAGRFDESARLGALAQRYRSGDPGVRALMTKLAAGREQAQTLARARQRLEAGSLVEPSGESAMDLYKGALQREPNSEAARQGLVDVETALIGQALGAADGGDFARADRLLAQAAQAQTGTAAVQNATVQVLEKRQTRAQALTAELLAAIQAAEFDRAEGLYGQLELVSTQGSDLDDLRLRLDNARNYASHTPGDIIVDPIVSGGTGPELVVIALGSFEMGSPSRERDRVANEGPVFTVSFARGFALGRDEITVAQFRQFVNATGHVGSAQRAGRATVYDENSGTLTERAGVTWQDDHLGRKAAPELPVIHVSWEDAKAYVEWLSRETGKRYRLPSEAEFEYALRAGSQQRYPWGDGDPTELVGNLTGDGDRSESRRNWANAFRRYSDGHWGPAPVRSYPANPFGLYDMVGNVSEWVEDCWHDTYQRAPTDGSAWVNPGCELRVLRGASWASAPDQVRSAYRLSAPPSTTNPRLGFRVARDL